MQARTTPDLDTVADYLKKIQDLRGHSTHIKSVFETHLKSLERQLKRTQGRLSSLGTIHLPFALIPVRHSSLIQEILELLNPKGLSLNLSNFLQPPDRGGNTLATFIPPLKVQELIIDANQYCSPLRYDELKEQYTTLFFTIRTSKIDETGEPKPGITSLSLKDCSLGNLNQKSHHEYGSFSLEEFLNEISQSPITSLSISNDSLDKWSDENWFRFLKAIKESETISKVEVNNTQLSLDRLQQLGLTLHEKAQKNTLTSIVARSIASNMLLFKKEELENLPEACQERIQYYSNPNLNS